MLCDCGSSALHWTARSVNERLVLLLLEAGVDVSVRDTYVWENSIGLGDYRREGDKKGYQISS
jgi:hypothetical protein